MPQALPHLHRVVGGGVTPEEVHEDDAALLHGERPVEDLYLLDAVDAAADAAVHTEDFVLDVRCQRQPVEHLQRGSPQQTTLVCKGCCLIVRATKTGHEISARELQHSPLHTGCRLPGVALCNV